MSDFRESLSLYFKNMTHILLIILLIVLPLQVIETVITITLLITFSFEGYYTVGLLLSMLISLVFLNLYQSAFIGLAGKAMIYENDRFSALIKDYLNGFIPVLLYSTLCAVGVFFGTFMLVLPGLLILVMMIFYPYVLIFDGKRDKGAFMKVFQMTKNHIVKVVAAILLFVSSNYIIWYVLAYTTTILIIDLFTLVMLRLLVNVLMIPLFVFYITIKYNEWSPESIKNLEAEENF